MKRASSNQRRRPTLKDVAELANVSVMTVSNVVNGKYEYVSKETRARVEGAVKKLNYYPSATSRRLRSRQEFSIGMIIADDAPGFLEDPFITEIVAGLSNYLSSNNYSLSIQGIAPENFSAAAMFSVVGTDALCAMLCGDDAIRSKNIDFLLTLRQPIVLFQETVDVDCENIAFIQQDDYEGGYIIALHVIENNAKRLVFLTPSMIWPAIDERKRGILSAIEETDSDIELDVVVCPHEGFDDTQLALQKYFARNDKPDAILGGNDRLGIAALRFCQDQGLDVPGDILITGFNGFESSRYTNPPLTTITSPSYEMGQHAGAMIIRRLQTDRFSKRSTLFPVRFQPGSST